MLKRIQSIRRVGLFNDADGSKFALGPNALIYADNGRGKSTLTAVLHSLSTGDPSVLEHRKTLDGTGSMSASLLLDDGVQAVFTEGTGWSAPRPDFAVFDTAFIDRNVHSGGEITPRHRESLLSFALGADAVSAQQAVDAAAASVAEHKKTIAHVTENLAAHHGNLSLGEFRGLAHNVNVDASMVELEARLAAAREAANILSRPMPEATQPPKLDIDELMAVLATGLEQVHEQADELVRVHLAALQQPDAEPWIRRGQELGDDTTCPYCGQTTEGLDLIEAYRAHFDTAYTQLVDRLAAAERSVQRVASDDALDHVVSGVHQADQLCGQWKEHCAIKAVAIDRSALAHCLEDLRQHCMLLLQAKSRNLRVPNADETDRRVVETKLAATHAITAKANRDLEENVASINAFKATLTSTSLDNLQAQLTRLRLTRTRHTPPVVALFKELTSAEGALKNAQTVQKEARGTLKGVMTTTLENYRAAINTHLRDLGAAFTIEAIETNFLGGSAKSDYAIVMRGRSLRASNGKPPLSVALSDGDKRTLAFAFFAASVLADPGIGTKIVVVDDPVSSLDRFRRDATSQILQRISDNARQLIVLAHDATLIRDLRDRFTKGKGSNPADTTVHCLARTPNDYTTFASVDIDAVCESDYYRNYRLVTDHVESGASDVRGSAAALRPLLEGHLNRRFPGAFTSATTLGAMITAIDNADSSSPLSHAKHLAPEMWSINAYASQFHHDSNPGSYSTQPVDDMTVKTHGKRILAIVHGEITPQT